MLDRPMLDRRGLLASGMATAALAALPAQGAGVSADAAARVALDSLAGLATPEAKLKRLADLSEVGLSPVARLDLGAVRAGLAIDAALARAFPFGRLGRSPYLVTPLSGEWTRATSGGAAIAAETERLRAEAAAGIVPPRAILDRTIEAIDKATGAAADRAAALRAQSAMLAGLRATAPVDPGVGKLPGGADYFALLLRRHFGDGITPEAAHARFVAEAARLERRADLLLRRQGLSKGSVGARYGALWRDARWLYSDDDAGRDRAVADMNRWLAAARARVASGFGAVPARCLEVSVRRLTAAEMAAGKAGYRTPPLPGAPGTYVVDLKDIRRRPRWTLASVVAHELLPGHMLQLPMEAMADPHPLRLDYAPAFVEGWGVYAEQRAAVDGLYRDDPLGELGHLHWLLFRVGRGLVDTGIHLKGWSIATARATLARLQGEPAYFAPFESDLERICLEPAIRAAEALSWLAIADLAASRRDRIALHHALLDHGRLRFEQFPKQG